MRFIVFFINLFVLVGPASSQRDTTTLLKGLRVNLHYGFIFAHSESVQNTAGARPGGIEMDLIRQRTDTATWDLCHCYPVKGFSFSYFDFDKEILGKGFTGAYFLEPSYTIGEKTQFSFRGSIGLSYLSNPYHPQKNPTNLSYSTSLSGFLRIGLAGSYQVAPQWLVQVGTQYQHVSNAGIKEPNKGINWPTASVGVAWFREHHKLPLYRSRDRLYGKNFRKEKPYLEAGVFFSAKQGYKADGSTPRTPLVGFLMQVEKQVGSISTLNTGIEFYYDNSLNQRLQKDSIKGSAYRAGLLAGHNFLLGRFLFSQQLGLYLYNHTPYYDRIYHRWILRYLTNRNFSIGLGFKAHRHVADFIDLRLMYRL